MCAQRVRIDGSQGEGGGQVLRTSLSLSLVTGRALLIENIRAGRKKPGLQPQHLTCVRAAAAVGAARVEGDAIGSKRLLFEPGEVRPGEYRFEVGTAGSATLVVQTVLPALMLAGAPSKLAVEGGTHNPLAPPYDFLERVFAPLVARMGPAITARLKRPGFYPVGGGELSVEIVPPPAGPDGKPALGRLDLDERGPVRRLSARAVVSRLPLSIAERELKLIRKRLHIEPEHCTAETVEAKGPGNVVMIEVAAEHVTELFTGFGQKGVPAEHVAAELLLEAKQYVKADVPVGEHLADQLLVPMALAGGGAFRTVRPSPHLTTNAEVIGQFLDVEIRAEKLGREDWRVCVGSW
jgi:RNA 3'-terminal phosphate cyclase (ATP)